MIRPQRPAHWFSAGAATGALYTLATIAAEGCRGRTEGMCGIVFSVLNYPAAATVRLILGAVGLPAVPGALYAGTGILNACVFGAAAVLYSRRWSSVPLFTFLAFAGAFVLYALLPWLLLSRA